jgi:tetratricopeptide (TPR) repeat protein
LILVLLVLAGAGAGLYGYALLQWQAAQTAIKEDRLDEARSRLAFCLRVWPWSVPVHLRAARAARLGGDFVGAEALLNQCLKLQHGATEDVQLEFLLMRVQAGEVDEVASALQSYVEKKHPETSLILETLSRAYMHDARYGPALGALDRWIQEDPEAAAAFFYRGWVMERLNDYEGSLKDYRRAVELAPDQVQYRLKVAEMLLEKSNPPEAIPHLERLWHQFPNRPDVLAALGHGRLLQGRREEARPLLEAAVEKLPDEPMLLLHLAQLEMQDDRPVEAEKWLRRLLKAEPFDQEAEYVLVGSLRLQGRQEEAAALLEQYEKHKALLKRATKLLEEEAKHPTNDPNNPAEAGTILLEIGQEHLGLYWLGQALQRDPNHQPSHKALADYFEKKGDSEKAAAHRRRLREPERKAGVP